MASLSQRSRQVADLANCWRCDGLTWIWSIRNFVFGVELPRTKNSEGCRSPRGLAPVLDMARLDPAGRPYPPVAHVFGKLGRRVRKIDKAWNTCVLKACGHEPVWTKHGKLAQESRAVGHPSGQGNARARQH